MCHRMFHWKSGLSGSRLAQGPFPQGSAAHMSNALQCCLSRFKSTVNNNQYTHASVDKERELLVVMHTCDVRTEEQQQ